MPGRQPLFVDSDNIVVVGPLTDRLDTLTAAQIQAATGTVTLYDASGTPVVGATGLSLALVSGSANRFYAAIDNAVSLTEDANYTLRGAIVAGGITLTLEEELVARYRT